MSAGAAGPAAARGAPGLRRVLGVGFGVAVAVGSMVGAGILRTPGDVARLLPTAPLFFGAWLLGGGYALLGANALAELGTMLPRSGGQYVFVRHALGPYAGFAVGWNDWLSTCGAVAAISLVLAGAIGALVPPLAAYPTGVACAGLAAVTAFLWRGARASDRAQRATSVFKAVALLALVAGCFVAAARGRHTPGPPSIPTHTGLPPAGAGLAAAFIVALQGVIYTYDGWTGVLYFLEELRDPGREIPRALLAGVLSVMAPYLLINASFLVVLPLGVMARTELPAAAAAAVAFGRGGGWVVQAVVAVALPSAVVANTLMASRVSFALGRDGAALAVLGRVNAGGTPGVSLLATAATVALFLATGTVVADPRTGLVALALVALSYPVFRALGVGRAARPRPAFPDGSP